MEPVVSAMHVVFVCISPVMMAVYHMILSELHMVHVEHTLPVSHWAHVCLSVLNVLHVWVALVLRVVRLLCSLGRLYMMVVYHTLPGVHV